MNKFELRPHPNYLKVVNTFVWTLIIFLQVMGVIYIDSISVKLITFISLTSFALIFIKFHVNHFIKQQFFIEAELFKEDFLFKQSFLAKAYGLGTLQIGKLKMTGIHIKDYKNILEIREKTNVR